jgi:outer membrane protein assembly factor BamB
LIFRFNGAAHTEERDQLRSVDARPRTSTVPAAIKEVTVQSVWIGGTRSDRAYAAVVAGIIGIGCESGLAASPPEAEASQITQALMAPEERQIQQWFDARLKPAVASLSVDVGVLPARSAGSVRGVDARRTGRSRLAGPDTNAVLWQRSLGDKVRSSPVIGPDGTIYVGSHANKLHAIHPQTGEVVWTFSTGFPGDVWASPAVASDGTIYIGSDNNSLQAVNPDGTLKWAYSTGADIKSSPVVTPRGDIVFGSEDDRVYCLTPSGDEKWRYKTGRDVKSSPAVGPDGTIFVGSDDDKLYALRPDDGSRLWSRDLDDRDVKSSPAVGVGGVLYVGSDANTLFALRTDDGFLIWKFTAPSGDVKSSPAIGADGTVYVGSDDGRLYAVSPSGQEKWRFSTSGAITSSPIVGAGKMIFFGSHNNRIYALRDDGNAATVVWTKQTGDDVRSSPMIGANNALYVGSDDGMLYALGRAPVTGAECAGIVGASCTCVCDVCLAEFQTCASDPGCLKIRDCALENSCDGTDCYQPATCQGVIDDFGGLSAPAARRFLEVEKCLPLGCEPC